MSSAIAPSDSNPTRAQLRLVVLGQWVRAGLDLARGASARRGLVGGAVALWQVFQAIRLAMQLARRLSELSDVLSRGARDPAPGGTPAPGAGPGSGDEPGAAAFLQAALGEIAQSIRDALGLGLVPARRRRPGMDTAAAIASAPEGLRALARLDPLRGRRPAPGRRRTRRRRPCAAPSRKISTPIAALAIGRLRLAAG